MLVLLFVVDPPVCLLPARLRPSPLSVQDGRSVSLSSLEQVVAVVVVLSLCLYRAVIVVVVSTDHGLLL